MITDRKPGVKSVVVFPSWRVILAVVLMTVAGCILFADKGFFTWSALMGVVRRAASEGGIAALGVTFVMLTGHVDFSVGAVLALSGVTAGMLQAEGAGIAITAALCAGAICGFINGMLISRLRLPSWLATLGMMHLTRNAAQLISRQRTLSVSSKLWQWLGSAHLLGIPISVLIFAVLTLLCMYVAGSTGFGESLYAAGRRRRIGAEGVPLAHEGASAMPAGRRLDKTVIGAFTCSGIFAALAGVLLAGRLYTVSYSAGSGWELTVLAMCLLGGVRLSGGKGRFSGVFFGALLVSLIGTLCNYTGVLGIEWQNITLCVLSAGAVLLQEAARRKENGAQDKRTIRDMIFGE